MPMKARKRARRRKALIKRDGAECWDCGAPDQPSEWRENKLGEDAEYVFLTVDHIVPSRHGGDDRLDNLRLLCEECHRDTQNMHPGGYHPDTGELSPDYIQNSRRYKRLRDNSKDKK